MSLSLHTIARAAHVPRSPAAGVELSLKVLVAHSSMLIAAGVAHTLGLQSTSMLTVRIWDKSQRPWHAGGSDRADVVFADSECLRLLNWHEETEHAPSTSRPELIWMTATAAGETGDEAEPLGTSARLPVDCCEHDLIRILDRLDAIRLPGHAGKLRSAPTGGLAPGAMKRVLAHIETHLATRVELAELAGLAGLSECHFARAFKQSTGIPPHRYLMTRRLAAAADLVARSDRELSDIALEVGFCDQSHFTRQFSRAFGESPRQYRRRHR